MADDPHVTFTLNDGTYTVRPNEITASLAAEFRAATGMAVRSALRLLYQDADIDIVRALMWLARRQGGERITLDKVDDFTYAEFADLAFEDEPAPEEPDSPEA